MSRHSCWGLMAVPLVDSEIYQYLCMTFVTELDLFNLPIGEQSLADRSNAHVRVSLQQYHWLAKSDYGIVIIEQQTADNVPRMEDRLKTPAGQMDWRLFPDVFGPRFL